jgi:hypothetical protein
MSDFVRRAAPLYLRVGVRTARNAFGKFALRTHVPSITDTPGGAAPPSGTSEGSLGCRIEQTTSLELQPIGDAQLLVASCIILRKSAMSRYNLAPHYWSTEFVRAAQKGSFDGEATLVPNHGQ